MSRTSTKYPADVLDYVENMVSRLATGDTVASVAVAVAGPDSALVVDSTATTTTTATAWVSGGTANARYKLTYTVTTTLGEVEIATRVIEVRRSPAVRAVKPAAATNDFTLDFAADPVAWMPTGDTIATATMSTVSGLTQGTRAFTDTTVTQRIGGGTAGTRYTVTCTITTAGGRTKTCDLILVVTP